MQSRFPASYTLDKRNEEANSTNDYKDFMLNIRNGSENTAIILFT